MTNRTTYGAASIPKPWLRRLDKVVVAEIRTQVSRLLALAGVSAPTSS